MDTAQQALFRAMLADGWIVAHGEDDAPTGTFGFVTNYPSEKPNILAGYGEVIRQYGIPTEEQFIGTFVVQLNSDGVINIRRCDNQAHCEDLMDDLLGELNAWLASDE